MNETIFEAWLENIDTQTDVERKLAAASRELDAAAEAAGMDLSGLLADYERLARRAGFAAGWNAATAA